MSIRLRHRRPARPALGNPCQQTGCACTISHPVTPEAVERVKDAVALALINGEADLAGYQQERLDTRWKCPAVQAQMEVR